MQPRPGHAAVARGEEPAAGTAAVAAPGVDLERPHPGEEDARVLRVHRDVGAAGVLVGEERLGPGLAAVGGAEDAALLLRAVGVAERARQHDVGILRVDHEARDAAGLLQAHERPGLAGVHGLVDALAERDVAADLALAGARPDDVRIGGRDGERRRSTAPAGRRRSAPSWCRRRSSSRCRPRRRRRSRCTGRRRCRRRRRSGCPPARWCASAAGCTDRESGRAAAAPRAPPPPGPLPGPRMPTVW